MQKVSEAVLTVVIFCLLEVVQTQTLPNSHQGDQGFSCIDQESRIYVHAQSHSNPEGDIHFRLSSNHCVNPAASKDSNSVLTSESCERNENNAGLPEKEGRDSNALNLPRGADDPAEEKCGNPTPSATFVTALYDIGRGHWAIFPRPYSIYLEYFKDVLKLNVNMVVIVDESDRNFVWQSRREANLTNSTKVWTKPYSDLAFQKHIPKIRNIIESEDFQKDNENLRHPEAFSPEYIILMNSKFSFLKEVADVNPFCSTHFVWIDAGYGHGKNVLPPEGTKWVPQGLIDVQEKLTIIQLEKPLLYEHYDKTTLFKLGARPAFIGGFFGGDSAAIGHLAKVHEETFESFLKERLVHEDQMMMLMCYFRKPEYFNPVEGSWFDGYKLFH